MVSKLTDYLKHTVHESHSYTHRLLCEVPDQRHTLIHDFHARTLRAHEDAKFRLRRLAGITLDPLGANSYDPAAGYPERLPLSALKGCFGEVMAGIIAEEFSHFEGDGWHVPAYAFRYHRAAFHYLERLRQGALVQESVIGRLGDDVLAFRMNASGEIIQTLVCEAKCTHDHQSGMVAEAHSKASEPNLVPVDVLQIIEILEDYTDDKSHRWKRSLQLLYCKGIDNLTDYERCDLISYTCGRRPIVNPTWITPDSPHRQYTAARRLEVVEIHLDGVDDLVLAVYAVKEGVHANR